MRGWASTISLDGAGDYRGCGTRVHEIYVRILGYGLGSGLDLG